MRDLLRRPLLALRVVLFAIAVPAIVRLPLGRQAALLQPRRRVRLDRAQAAWLIRRTDTLLARGRPLIKPGCLTRGLTLFYFLRRAGLDVRLQYGMGRIDGEMRGHCWLVLDGAPLLEKVDPDRLFVPTYSIPAA
jgi:hypothetical protein